MLTLIHHDKGNVSKKFQVNTMRKFKIVKCVLGLLLVITIAAGFFASATTIVFVNVAGQKVLTFQEKCEFLLFMGTVCMGEEKHILQEAELKLTHGGSGFSLDFFNWEFMIFAHRNQLFFAGTASCGFYELTEKQAEQYEEFLLRMDKTTIRE